MNALSNLLKRVAKHVLSNSPTNETMLETADRVVSWSETGYIGESEVSEIAAVVQDVDAPALQPAADDGAESGEGAREYPDLSAMTKAELLDYAESIGVEASESWTKAQIAGAIEAAER